MKRVLVTGAAGFVGRFLVEGLLRRGVTVRAASRTPPPSTELVEWVRCAVSRPDDLLHSLEGVDAAYFLVHSMGAGRGDYAAAELEGARHFADAAKVCGVERLIYLGGVAPEGPPSVHLESRLAVGEVLRASAVPTLELRASMIVGPGSASWQLVRDLSFRLPAMVLPQWTKSSTCPVAIEDVVTALVAGLEVPLPESAWFDLPGPEILTGAEVLLRVARQGGRRVPAVPIPLVTPLLSTWWLRLVTGANRHVARELVLGFTSDLLPRDGRYWDLIGAPPRLTFDEAMRRTLEQERLEPTVSAVLGASAEFVVRTLGQRLGFRRRPFND